MAKMNLLRASYSGKLGETVGAKWRDEKTIRSLPSITKDKTRELSPQQKIYRRALTVARFSTLFEPWPQRWKSNSMSAWNMRLSYVIKKMQEGCNDFDALPLTNGILSSYIKEIKVTGYYGQSSACIIYANSAEYEAFSARKNIGFLQCPNPKNNDESIFQIGYSWYGFYEYGNTPFKIYISFPRFYEYTRFFCITIDNDPLNGKPIIFMKNFHVGIHGPYGEGTAPDVILPGSW